MEAIKQSQERLMFYSKFFLGGLSGMFAWCFVHPCKNRMQVATRSGPKVSTFGIISNIVKQVGFIGLYSGLLRQASYTTTRLGIYTVLFEHFPGEDGKPPSFLHEMGCGRSVRRLHRDPRGRGHHPDVHRRAAPPQQAPQLHLRVQRLGQDEQGGGHHHFVEGCHAHYGEGHGRQRGAAGYILSNGRLSQNSPRNEKFGKAELFVHGIDEHIKHYEMMTAFGKYGTVTDAHNTGKGYAFITFSSPAETQDCLKGMDGMSVFGRTVQIKQASDRGQTNRQ